MPLPTRIEAKQSGHERVHGRAHSASSLIQENNRQRWKGITTSNMSLGIACVSSGQKARSEPLKAAPRCWQRLVGLEDGHRSVRIALDD